MINVPFVRILTTHQMTDLSVWSTLPTVLNTTIANVQSVILTSTLVKTHCHVSLTFLTAVTTWMTSVKNARLVTILFFQEANHAKRIPLLLQTVYCKTSTTLVSVALLTLTREMTRNVTVTFRIVKFTAIQLVWLATLITIHQVMACIVTWTFCSVTPTTLKRTSAKFVLITIILQATGILVMEMLTTVSFTVIWFVQTVSLTSMSQVMERTVILMLSIATYTILSMKSNVRLVFKVIMSQLLRTNALMISWTAINMMKQSVPNVLTSGILLTIKCHAILTSTIVTSITTKSVQIVRVASIQALSLWLALPIFRIVRLMPMPFAKAVKIPSIHLQTSRHVFQMTSL